MDVFEFDDEEDPKSPPTSPDFVRKKGTVKAARRTTKQPPSTSERDITEPSPTATITPSLTTASSSSTSSSSASLITKHNNDNKNSHLRSRRSRHARILLKQQEEEEERRRRQQQQQQQQQKPISKATKVKIGREENNGCSPTKHVHFMTDKNKNINRKDGEEDDFDNHSYDDEEEGSASLTSSSILSKKNGVTGIVNPRRKRRRKQHQSQISDTTSNATANSRMPFSTEEDEDKDEDSPRKVMKGSINNSINNNNKQSSTINARTTKPLVALPSLTSSRKSRLSISQQIQQKLQQHERQHQQLHVATTSIDNGDDDNNDGDDNHDNNSQTPMMTSIVSLKRRERRRVRGAGRDVYDIQDAGNFQMIIDECEHLTSSIINCSTNHMISKATIIECVSELAVMLSYTKTRQTLWATTSTTTINNNNTLESVLDVSGHITNALTDIFQQSNQQRLIALAQKQLKLAPTNIGSKNSPSQKKTGSTKGGSEQNFALVMPPPINRNNSNNSNDPNIVEIYYKGLLLDCLAAIVSFLSWDCTVDNKASAHYQNTLGARTIRKTILQHDGALSAFLFVIRHADPVVSNILETQLQTSCSSLPPHGATIAAAPSSTTASIKNGLMDSTTSDHASFRPPEGDSPSKISDGRSSVASSTNDPDSNSINITSTTDDPTAAGRRKRRRKKAGLALEPIAEDGSYSLSFNDGMKNGDLKSPPRSPPRRVVFEKKQETTNTNNDAKSKFSFTSEDAMSPPRSPLRRRGLKIGSPTRQSDRDDGSSSMVSCDSTLLKIHEQIGNARSRFVELSLSNHHQHDCQAYRELPLAFGGKDPAGSASSMALDALHRLLTGKEKGDSHSCLDESASDANNNRRNGFMSPVHEEEDEAEDGNNNETEDSQASKGAKPSDDDDILRDNPILQTNRMLAESGVIPILARGVAETLGAVVVELQQQLDSSTSCQACLRHLSDKFERLAPVVDNACVFHDDNRTDLCETEISDGDSGNGILIGSLVMFLKQWYEFKSRQNNCKGGNRKSSDMAVIIDEMALSALRTLTSLTHENSLAAEQMTVVYLDISNNDKPRKTKKKSKSSLSSWNGVQVIAQILYRAATTGIHNMSNKVVYDTLTCCLNTLANVIGDEPHGDVRRILVSMKTCRVTKGKGDSMHILSWLTQWVVDQTESFRDAIMMGSFGDNSKTDTNGHHSNRELEKNEDDLLMTAGNGCVLLACLLMDPPNVNNSNAVGNLRVSSWSTDDSLDAITQTIREIILSEMPIDDTTGLPTGTTFIQNTLRAFSNLLYYKLGDLSVAVVAPVRKLITELEKIQVEVV